MNITARRLATRLGVLALIADTAALLSSYSPAQSRPQETIKIDGSITVYPITNAIAAEFQAQHLQKKGEIMAVLKTHVSLNVTNIEKSVAFYQAMFGVTPVKQN